MALFWNRGICSVNTGNPGGNSFFLSIPAAGLFTAGVGTTLALSAARFKRVYILVATLAGQFIIDYALVHWKSLTGGLDGLKTPVSIPNLDVGSMTVLFYIIFICFGAMLWLSANLLRTKTGRAFMAIGQNERDGCPDGNYSLFP